MQAEGSPMYSHRSTDRSQKTVLIVDDEESIRASLGRFLTSQGYQVQTADSAEVAAILIRKQPVHAIVLDVRMPTLSGLNLLEWLHTEPDLAVKAIRVLILTGHSLTDLETNLVQRYRVLMFQKPVRVQEIVEALDAALIEEPEDQA